MNAREIALKALTKVRRIGTWTDTALDNVLSDTTMDTRDAALAAKIFYGVIQNMALCDFYIAAFSTVKTTKMEPQVLDILRLSVYQLIFLSKIPVNAAVNEGVELSKKYANPRAAGLVNAVLRKIATNRDHLPAVKGATHAEILSIKYSHPLWLVEKFIKRIGEEGTEALLKANNSDTAITVRVNTQSAALQDITDSLKKDNVEAQRHPWLAECLVLNNVHHIERLESFQKGNIYVQDPAATLAVKAAGPEPGMFLIDGCAAPGGKSFTSAIEMADTGHILSCDISEKKLRRIADGARRLGFKMIETRLADGRVPDPLLFNKADIVIADVPCSGFGVIRKKPEIRYKSEEEIKRLPEIQLQIIENLSKYVKPGGILLYSTCTLLKEENDNITTAFLDKHSEFSPDSFSLPCPTGEIITDGKVTLWPHMHGTDGFFICRMRRLQ